MFWSQPKETLNSSLAAILLALVMGLAIPMSLAFSEELLNLETADDVEVQSVSGLSGLITVSVQSNSGENFLRIIDLDHHTAMRPSAMTHAITDVSASHSAYGMVYTQSPKNGGGLMWSLLDGTLAMRLSELPLVQAEVTFGRSVGEYVFVGELGSDSKELFGISSSTSPPVTQLTEFGGRNTTPHVNPRTGIIAYSTSRKFPGWDVCLFDPSTKRDTCPLGSSSVSFCRPKWSPLGDQLVYSRGQGSSIDLYTYRTESGESKRITSLAHKEYDGAWSPDASHLVFSHNPSGSDLYELKVVRLSDGEIFKLAESSSSMRGASWIAAQPYATPTTTPSPQRPNQPASPPDDEGEPSALPIEATPIPLSPPKVTMKVASRSRALVTIISKIPASIGEIAVRHQVNGRASITRVGQRVTTFHVPRYATVRAAIRADKTQPFSPWSPWVAVRSIK